jgi:molybdate transport system regulatory protein
MSNERSAREDRPGIWFRALLDSGSIGPGKVTLMRHVAETGSVSAAAKRMRMSHARSVKLVAELNALGATPLIETRSGGEAGGGASLTPLGHSVLDLYDRLDDAMREAAREPLGALVEALKRG